MTTFVFFVILLMLRNTYHRRKQSLEKTSIHVESKKFHSNNFAVAFSINKNEAKFLFRVLQMFEFEQLISLVMNHYDTYNQITFNCLENSSLKVQRV